MLWLASGVKGYSIGAADGTIGSVVDLLFDDEAWTVRWLVIDTGGWLSGRQVLLPPSCLGAPLPAERVFPTSLLRKQVEDSPPVEADAPVSRQMESDIYGYYGWTPYWPTAIGYPAAVTYPGIATPGAARPAPVSGAPTEALAHEAAAREARLKDRGDPHLRSTGYVTGYAIQASDGEIGHVEDFLIDDGGWRIRYMVVDTVNWWPGKKVLVAPNWISDISWSAQQVRVDQPREKIKNGPEYSPASGLDRGYERELHRYYGYAPYWE